MLTLTVQRAIPDLLAQTSAMPTSYTCRPAITTEVNTRRAAIYCKWEELAYIVVEEFDLWEGEGIIQGHKDCRLDQNVDHVHGSMPKKEG